MARYKRQRPKRLEEKLIAIREGLGFSQTGMLHQLGLGEERNRSTVSSYELGASEPALPILLQYARLAGICLDVIVDDELDLPKRLPGTPSHDVRSLATRKRRGSKR